MVSLLNRKIISLIIIWVLIIISLISIQINNIRAETEPCKNEDEKRIIYNATRSSKLPIHQLTFENYDHMDPSFSPDGKKIVYASKEDGGDYFDIWIMDSDGQNHRQLTYENYSQRSPRFHPYDNKLIYLSTEDGTISKKYGPRYNIWIMNADGYNHIQLTNEDIHFGPPYFSSDGKKIVYHKYNFTPNYVWLLDLETMHENQVTNFGSDSCLGFSPNGSYILFHTWLNRQQQAIYKCDLDGNNCSMITSAFEITSGNYRPDGKKILYTKHDLYIIDEDGTNDFKLTEDGFSGESPVFSPHMDKIIYTSKEDGGNYSDIWVMEYDSISPPQIKGLKALDTEVGGKINLYWNETNVDDFHNYNIYMSENKFTNIENLKPIYNLITDLKNTTYQVNGLNNGNKYYFAVTAVDNKGNENNTVNSVSAIPTNNYYKPDPAIFSDRIILSNNYPLINETLIINATIENLRNTSAENLTINFTISEYPYEINYLLISENFSLDINSTKMISINWTPTNVNFYKVIVEIILNESLDYNNSNNLAEKYFSTALLDIEILFPLNNSEVSGIINITGNVKWQSFEQSFLTIFSKIDNFEWLFITNTSSNFYNWTYILDTSIYQNGLHIIYIKAEDFQNHKKIESIIIDITTIPLNDIDNDKIPDDWEIQYGLNPYNSSDASQDKDSDGFSNKEEFDLNTDPSNPNDPKKDEPKIDNDNKSKEKDYTFFLILGLIIIIILIFMIILIKKKNKTY